MRLGDAPVLEPSAIKLLVDGFDLGSSVSFRQLERYETNESFPWHGAHATAVDRSQGARLGFTNDLARQDFVLEMRAFNDGAACRLIVPGAATRGETHSIDLAGGGSFVGRFTR